MSKIKVISVSPTADLVLVVNDLVELHVSCDVLRAASKVFDLMLKPVVKYGKALQIHTGGEEPSPFKYPLNDIDQRAMVLLCHVLHNGEGYDPADVSADELLAFAELVKYYDCLPAVEHAVPGVVVGASRTADKTDLHKILLAAVALNDAVEFERLT